ncbi:hypothetical protein [Lutibacter sp.]|uniref:hypothetical protein n=1 Tax=Lutibacter sp. TaxID=1925666 RepID=UPI0025C5CED1|nr:hypothetical protein [Lutibacter sp.]MCF6169285.1 hypothetical protein [Lutibacter sp.]
MEKLINQYKENSDLVYQTWFIENEERLKAFRSIRRGVYQIIKDIYENKFPNNFKGSSLEFVLSCITEQKQVFEGASHPFYWKPKLRIPDIYENQNNKQAFGKFLESCINATNENQLIKEIISLDQLKIKGVGPALTNILYFLHPTIIPPFNTAMVRGFNMLFNEKIKLGSWKEYLKMREIIIQQNQKYKKLLSNDLGAFCGLLFEVGNYNLFIENQPNLSDEERSKIRKKLEKRHKKVIDENEEKKLHSEMQYHLLKIGKALNYDVIAASNDRSKGFNGKSFSSLSLKEFPKIDIPKETLNTVKLIDVIWFEKDSNKIVCAFEVEKSTSIYSGILRLSDLSFSLPNQNSNLYIIIPDKRENEVKFQLSRPSIVNGKITIKYILTSDLKEHCEALCKFGDSHIILEKISNGM